MRIPQKRSRTGPDWHRGTWQPFESVRQACEESAARMKEPKMTPTINVTAEGLSCPLTDTQTIFDDLSASVRRSLRGRDLEADLFPEVQEVLVELRFLRDLNDTLKALVVEMRAHAEETKARLERMESEHEAPIKAG